MHPFSVKTRSRHNPPGLCRRSGLHHLVYLTDGARDPKPLDTIRHLPPGTLIILRDYDASDRAALGHKLRRVCRSRRQVFAVAGSPRLARQLRADGLHLPTHALPRPARLHGQTVLSVAVHHGRDQRWARLYPGALSLIAPVFETRSRGGQRGIGIHRLARLAAGLRWPVALGGIRTSTAGKLRGLGVVGVAAIDGLKPPRTRRG